MKLRSIVLCLLLGLLVAPESSASIVTTLAPEADARILAIVDDRRPEFLSVYTVGNNIQRSLIRFDLTGIPAGQTITSASLTLFTNIGFGSNPNNLSMDIFRITRPWVEPEATWNNASDSTTWTNPGADGDFVGRTGQPGVDPYSVSTANPTSNNEPVTWDITTLAQDWHDGIHDNHGLLLLSQQSNRLVFHGTGFADSSVHPKLELTLTEPAPVIPEPTTFAVWGLLGITFGVGAWWKRRRTAA